MKYDSSEHDNPIFADEILQQTNKRLTLNLLIQGAGMHSFITIHHLVKDDLEAIKPGLTERYDRLSACLSHVYFVSENNLLFGFPSLFWRRTRKPSHPFYRHKLLATHGRELWLESKRFLIKRAWPKKIYGIPVVHTLQLLSLIGPSVEEIENEFLLARLAEQANALMWGIDQDRLEGTITKDVAFGNLQRPKTRMGRFTRHIAIGYGGVELRNGQFKVVANAIIFPLLLHELTKGIAELVCLHGLNDLDEETYEKVIDYADQLELETWLLQAGSEMWRRFLHVIPQGQKLSEALMNVARLEPVALENLMMAIIENPEHAKTELRNIG